MDPSPKSLVLDLLSTLGRSSAPVRALVAAGALFGIGANSLRVALARLVSDGLVERDSRGRYRLGPKAAAVNEEIRGWRLVEERVEAWSGAWVAAHLGGAARRSPRERRARSRALRLVGFRTLAPGLEVRPDNLVGGVPALRQRLLSLGLGEAALVCRLDELDAEREQQARSLWDGDELVQAYRATVRSLEKSGARLPTLPVADAMAESFRLGGAALRQVILDPLLPEPIVPSAERRALVEAMRHYDRLGRRVWAGWLGEDTPHDHPVAARGGENTPHDLLLGVRRPAAGAASPAAALRS